MAVSPASDFLNLKTEELVLGDDAVHKNMDDILIESPGIEVLIEKLRKILDRARQLNITFSIKKFKIGRELIFGGFLVKVDKDTGEVSVLPDPKKIEALNNIQPPSNRTELLSFLGLAKMLTRWSPNLSFNNTHLRELSSKGRVFKWNKEHQM